MRICLLATASEKEFSHASTEHETKFVLDNHRAQILINWLNHRCTPDPQYPKGIVNSIYFDTPDWQFLGEKINSDFLKTKVRLRWYSDMDGSTPDESAFVEVKYKIGAARKKYRKQTDLSAQWLSNANLNSPKLGEVPFMLIREGIMAPSRLLAAFKIAYKRFRFIEPVTSARLSVDYDISAPAVNHQMIGRNNPFVLRNAVFELKGSEQQLPHVLHQLTALGCRKDSFSKYSMCYQKITGTHF